MTDPSVRRKLTEGIVKLVEELIDYKTEVTIGGFVKITADKCSVIPVTIREYRKRAVPWQSDDNKSSKRKSPAETPQKFSSTRSSSKRKLPQVSVEESDSEPRYVSKKVKVLDDPTECSFEIQLDKEIEERQNDDKEEKDVDVAEQRTSEKKSKIKLSDVAEVEKRFPCVMCSQSNKKEVVFETEHELLTHGRLKHRENLKKGYKCKTCDQIFQSFFKLQNHDFHIHSRRKNYTCKMCSKKFTWAFEIRRHSKDHGAVTYTCMKCPWPGKKFYNYSKYAYHRKTAHIETKCKKCEEVFKSRLEMRKHFLEKHIIHRIKRRKRKMEDILKGKTVKEVNIREIPKPQIGLQQGQENTIFIRTKKSKSGKESKILHEPHKCPHCDMVYWHQASLRNHIHGQHSENKYTCSVCGISVKHESSLTRHMKSHAAEERSFACDQCSKTYKRNCELLRHKKVKHSGLEKTFVCSVCGSKFMTATDLKAHEKRHVSSGKLVLHKGRYPSRKGEIFCCGECHKTFQKESLLKSHISVTHKNERNFGCGVCGKFYGRSCHLRRHQLVAHGIRAKDTVLIKEDRDVEDNSAALQLEQEGVTTFTVEGAGELVGENTEFVILSEDAETEAVVIQPSEEEQTVPESRQEEVVVLHQCPICSATYQTDEEVRLHLTNDHNAIVVVETDEQAIEEWVPTS